MAFVTLRLEKGDILTHIEVDDNFKVVRQAQTNGYPDHDNNVTYNKGATVIGTDGNAYTAQEDGVLNVDPTTDATGKWKQPPLLSDVVSADTIQSLYNAETYSSIDVYPKDWTVFGPDGILYYSLEDENVGNDVTDPLWWGTVKLNINDDVVSVTTTWSSQKTTNFSTAMAIALG